MPAPPEQGLEVGALGVAQIDPATYVHRASPLPEAQMNHRVAMSAKNFTERQGQYLAFIDAYTRLNGRPPAESDMQRHFGVSPLPRTRWC